MPTYAYRCTQCGNAFDAVQDFTDDALTECPACGGRLRKLYGSVGVTFNGSGFYRTDSRASTGSSPSGSGGESGGASSSGAAASSGSGGAGGSTAPTSSGSSGSAASGSAASGSSASGSSASSG